jgi:hypothetical protein
VGSGSHERQQKLRGRQQTWPLSSPRPPCALKERELSILLIEWTLHFYLILSVHRLHNVITLLRSWAWIELYFPSFLL